MILQSGIGWQNLMMLPFTNIWNNHLSWKDIFPPAQGML
jgi:hypothetical protein